eukprot:g9104.t1
MSSIAVAITTDDVETTLLPNEDVLKKRENIILFLNNIMNWLEKEDIYNMLKQKCNEKEEDEKGEIIEDVLQNQYTTVWKDITSEDGGEESLVTSMKDFNEDFELLKIYRAFRVSEDLLFDNVLYGKEENNLRKQFENEIDEYSMKLQKEYLELLKASESNGVKQLNDKVKDLLPLVSELKEKTSSSQDPYKLELEDMKPLIQFRVIEQLLKKTAQNGLGKFLNTIH